MLRHNPIGYLLSLAALCVAGCTADNTLIEPSYSLRALEAEAEPLSESLFPGDQAVMSNEAIAQILDSPVFIADQARLAVIRFGGMPRWWGWSDDFVRISQEIDSDFLERLRGSPRLQKVAYLPSLVTPRHMTIPYLREAAVRFQSDQLLIYRTTTGTYTNRRLLGADEVRAYCTVEGILLDVRTGTISFSTVITEQFEARKDRNDKNFEETVAKASQQAIGRAWLRLAEQTVAFLDEAPRAPSAGAPALSPR